MTEIVLTGIIENRKQAALIEVNQLLDIFFPEKEKPIAKFIVAENFASEISQLTNSQFNPVHEYGQAAAKTLHSIKDSKLVFDIVLDGRIFGRWLDEEKIFRHCILVHEFTHVDYEYFVWEKIGSEQFTKKYLEKPKSCNETILYNASMIWEEYEATRVTIEFLASLAEQCKGSINDTLTLGNTQQLYETVNGMTGFIKQKVYSYMLYQMSLDDMQYQVSSRIVSALILWAYTIPAVGVEKEVTERYVAIEKLDDYAILKESLACIKGMLEELYQKRDEYLPELIHKIAEQIELILEKCGLTFEELPNGSTYTHVKEPSF